MYVVATLGYEEVAPDEVKDRVVVETDSCLVLCWAYVIERVGESS